MTSAFLQSELASLIQDSKRRSSEVRTAAEKAFADLKTIHVTSETQLAGDLLRRPRFIDPFILACNTKHVKLAVTGAVCLQRLAASNAIPPERLGDVLDAFQEAAHLGLDVQLKVLQALPSLLQLYANDLQGDPLAKVLSLCAGLAGNKTALVSSTAVATFQQLITTVFDKQSQDRARDGGVIGESDDAPRIFDDACRIVKGEQPQFLKTQGLSLQLALEVVETSLSNQELALLDIPGCLTTCQIHLVPGIVEVLERTTSFPVFGRTLRALYLLITSYLDRVHDSLAAPFATILSIIDKPSGFQWKRILCLEFMRSISSEYQLMRSIFALFDRRDNQHGVIGNFMSILVRIAAEDPALIGLGRQSTIPTNQGSDSSTNIAAGAQVEVDAVGSVLQASSNVTGISSRWSTLGTSLLDQLDKPTAPEVPATYIYTLVLGCVSSFADGLSKFIIPLSVPNRASLEPVEADDPEAEPTTPVRKNSQVRRADRYQRLLNPLTRTDVSNKEDIQVCANMIEDCWPAVLATCSTFLNSALDSYFYHMLIRAVQKLAQVSGVLELLTPRDALLTTLAKVSVPVNAASVVTALHGNRPARLAKDDDIDDGDEASVKSPVLNTPRHSVDTFGQPLNVRNLLCLRALLNLGIALGPTLSETSWFIIIQALQQVEALMSVSPTARGSTSKTQPQEETDVDGQTSLGSEITAVGTASKRMFESTKFYSNDNFKVFILSIFKMIESLVTTVNNGSHSNGTAVQQELAAIPRRHKASRSVSGVLTSSVILQIEAEFVLKTINDIARINLHRFISTDAQPYSWDLIIGKLLILVSCDDVNPQLRLQAASIIDIASMETIKMLEKQEEEDRDDLNALHDLCLGALSKQVLMLYKQQNIQSVLATDVEIHRRLLDALENIVSNIGETLTSGWRTVFQVLQTTMTNKAHSPDQDAIQETQIDQDMISNRTIPPAFRTVQLIVSDFLNTIDPASVSILIQLLPLFGMQQRDLNISLTTSTLFWNVSSTLLEKTSLIEVPENTAGSPVQSRATATRSIDASSLWIMTVRQLCRLCEDERSDVRNSAIRVLVRVFDSSSQQLTSYTWKVSLQKAFIPLLKEYSEDKSSSPEWHSSFTQLVEGFVSLFVQNIEAISTHPDFITIWNELVVTLNMKLALKTPDGHTVVFNSLAEMVRALHKVHVLGEGFVYPVLRTWSQNHPADLEITEQSNQDALCAHAQLLAAIDEVAPELTKGFSLNDQSLVQIAIVSSKRTALSSVHPPYSNDVNKLAPEQIALVSCIGIVKQALSSQKHVFADFLIDLVSSILVRHTGTEVEKQKSGVKSKSVQKPTLVALLAQCITSLRDLIREEKPDQSFLEHTSAPQALSVLTRVIETKYTKMPTNNDFPAWQNATVAMVELIEATADQVHHISSDNVKHLSKPITDALTAIVTAAALDAKDSTAAPDVVTNDEQFDMQHFTRFHAASRSLLCLGHFPIEQRKQYMITLFHASLVAKPWFGDLPSDLLDNPLSTFKDIRPGSIRPPDFLPRTNIPYEALDALFGLVDQTTTVQPDSPDGQTNHSTLADTAAPYVLLRIAHTLKTFLADQRLRNLVPPPYPLQNELGTVLTQTLALRVLDTAFTNLIKSSQADATDTPLFHDGKTHLRLLHPLVLQLREFWVRLPRLKVCAWQDDGERGGLAAQKALEQWGRVLAEGWDGWI